MICSNHFSRCNTVVHVFKGKEGIVFLPNNKTKHVKKLYSNISKDKVLEVSYKINGRCTYVLTSHNINETIYCKTVIANNRFIFLYFHIFLLTRSSLGKCTSCTPTIACFYFVFATKWTTFHLFGDTRVRLEKKIARTCRILWVDCTIFSVLHALRSFARFNRTLCLKVVRLFFESIQILKINLYCWHDFFSKLISIAAFSDWWYEWRLGPSLRWSQIKSYFLTCSLS